jgi:hypothetical protein
VQNADQQPGLNPPACYVTPERYIDLLYELLDVARGFDPLPDSVVGRKRSGLFPAVFLSHQLSVPMFCGTEAKVFPYPKFLRPLVVDTTAWSGLTMRRILSRLKQRGVTKAIPLVMFARADPPPNVRGLNYLALSEYIPRFWYSTFNDVSAPPETLQGRHHES